MMRKPVFRSNAFTSSIGVQASNLQEAIDKKDWDEASDLLDDIESDYERLRGYVDEQLRSKEGGGPP